MSETFEIPDAAPAAEEVTIAPAEPVDPAAPYGRFANGKARKAPPKASKSSAPKTAAAPRVGPPRAPKKSTADYRPVIEQGLTMVSVALMGLGRKNRAFLADAATVQMSARQGAHVLNGVAQINPGLQRLLETSAPAVPYLELGTFLFGLGAQIAANHGVRIPGAQVEDPDQLASAMEAQMQATAQQMQAAEAAQANAPQQPAPVHDFASVA